VGQTIVDSPLVDAISFTGSVPVGEALLKSAAQRRAKVQLEMGGKNPLVVLDDAELERAIDCAVNGAFFSTGQRCTASSRLIVTAGIHDRFVQALRQRVDALVVGNALTRGVEIGPVVSEPQHRIAREEIFGPVASVIRAADYDEALALANDTPFGLCAGVVTTSLKHAAHFRRHAQVGMAMVNLPTAGVDYHVPFGGRKGSSHGPREQGRYAAEFYTAVKTSYVSP